MDKIFRYRFALEASNRKRVPMKRTQEDLTLAAYHYDLPACAIAQHPATRRDSSRLMVLHTRDGKREHRLFSDIEEYFRPNDILVINNTKVFPARLAGTKETGGKIEVFLLEFPQIDPIHANTARVKGLFKSSIAPKAGTSLSINETISCRVLELQGGGMALFQLHFDKELGLRACLERAGEVPLPPYIQRRQGTTAEDRQRYQTVYATTTGAVAAPTAGLHFTRKLLKHLQEKGVETAEITLHVGHGTFAPVRVTDIRAHTMHSEYLQVSRNTVNKIKAAQKKGGRVWAVGTTSARALEYAANKGSGIQPIEGWCDLYIYPGFAFQVVDNLITNFHLPKSSLLFLVSALCGRSTLLQSYQEAIQNGYRFFSYGDAMAIIKKE